MVFLDLAYILVWAQNFSTIQWISFPIHARSVLELQVYSYRLHIGQDRLNVALIMQALTKYW